MAHRKYKVRIRLDNRLFRQVGRRINGTNPQRDWKTFADAAVPGIKKVPAIGKEPRKAARSFTAHATCQWCRSASNRSHTIQPARVRCEYDYPFAAPGSAACLWRIAERDGRAACSFDLFELAACEKCDVAVIGRPKRMAGALRAGERLGTQRVERANP